MSRSIRKSRASQARMYQHFAVVTLVITAAIAMFADGSQPEAVAATAVDKPDAIDLAAQGKDANAIKVTEGAAKGSFGSDIATGGYGFAEEVGGGYDQLADSAGDAIGYVASIPATLGPAPGMSRAAWEEQRRRAQPRAEDQATPQQISDLVEQSRARSGLADTSDSE